MGLAAFIKIKKMVVNDPFPLSRSFDTRPVVGRHCRAIHAMIQGTRY